MPLKKPNRFEKEPIQSRYEDNWKKTKRTRATSRNSWFQEQGKWKIHLEHWYKKTNVCLKYGWIRVLLREGKRDAGNTDGQQKIMLGKSQTHIKKNSKQGMYRKFLNKVKLKIQEINQCCLGLDIKVRIDCKWNKDFKVTEIS